ncbi:MAG: Aminoglycoside N3-acetyltransferase [Halanaerobium sp. 4-GBenrich]|uniref:Aminoglycoside N(3)-acetyltransferase n=1 Tax=Halanaerobium congolense TaxID=54121 RepID=A0A1G6MB28_9FIRM|nr:AAC(3) family N-acetyltransferase [Halanaerobium congolense]KXS49676.1 MAG: Aminoglycoside N3-acetyltransferase [Halanaerobium sp. T82-1]ODS50196.1 MAG: Aminoglycoside N3-acetyltransferase [Halanaerobium sp. 4-GBenrich]OEG61787.1 MAG: AAC(3) family N-acetyltransferase [Halanaerobium sp. MDAL1]PUU92155.1 MAG: Aminoglycoside N3-acetyltransferase [Halanaerobium sp.]PTX17236.1 aminoglycoside 3-N-acetyltransferase [Halanaerobium congolense]
MNEKEIIEKTKKPITKKSLVNDLKQLNLKGEVVIVHSALSKLGWVCGGAVALIEALQEAVTEEGTLIMPAHSSDFSEPKYWGNPPVPKEWYQTIRDEMPAYRPEVTPTRGLGVTPEIFRKFPNVVRSDHPCLSFAAWGKEAEAITADHKLDYALGENSPLAKIYRRKGKILLIGVRHESNTSLHLAEYRAEHEIKIKIFGSSILKGGKNIWTKYQDIEFNDDLFPAIGKEYESEYKYSTAKIGLTEAKLFDQQEMVDFAVDWLEKLEK